MLMDVKLAKEILALVQANPSQTTYTQAQVKKAIEVLGSAWAKGVDQ